MKTIGSQIQSQRKKLGITQKELSQLSGVGINTIVALERGRGNPSLSVLMKLAETLGLRLSLEPKTFLQHLGEADEVFDAEAFGTQVEDRVGGVEALGEKRLE